MSMASIVVEFTVGTDIKDACREMMDMKNKLGYDITTKFNGIDVYTYPNCIPSDMVTSYHKMLKVSSKISH